MSGNYLLAISLTTQLSNQVAGFWDAYPEQVLVYFPQPYQEIYQRAATQSYMDQEIPLAISRQESSFEAEAMSPAEAMGLMQLMSNTAQRQASRLGLRIQDPLTDLKRPELNITLGTAYLAELGRRYRGQWHQAFAAYNAGEYVVDAWLQRRRAEDPLVWIEALSFAETSGYTKNVWRNWEVYRWLRGLPAAKPLL
jgi:soluble lytic murein transglycosylase